MRVPFDPVCSYRMVFMPLDPAWPSAHMELAAEECALVLCTDPFGKGVSHGLASAFGTATHTSTLYDLQQGQGLCLLRHL